MQRKVEILIEQTDFLLEKQKEALHDIEEVFTDLVKTIQAKSKQANLKAEDSKSLANIENMILEKMNEVTEQVTDDIEFLEQQLKALTTIAAEKDHAKSDSMLKKIFDDEEDLLETEEFKSTITEESAMAKQDLVSVANDIKEAIAEGNIRDVELLLEAMGDGEIELKLEEGEDDEDADFDECDECLEEKCEDSCCKSGKRDMERVNVDIFKCCGDENEDCCSKKNKSKK